MVVVELSFIETLGLHIHSCYLNTNIKYVYMQAIRKALVKEELLLFFFSSGTLYILYSCLVKNITVWYSKN